MPLAQRLAQLGGNVFAEMDTAKAQAQRQGKTLLDLSLGSADLPTPAPIVAAIAAALGQPQSHGYLLHRGTYPFRQAVAHWYEQRFGISVDPETEVLPLIGSQEGTAHLPLAVLNPGDVALLLDPGYPSHAGGVHLAGGIVHPLPLRPENDYLPVWADIPPRVLERAKLLVLSYPHNPTTALAPLGFFEEAVVWARQQDLVLVHDFPYLDLVFEVSRPAPSIFQATTQKENIIEFFTFSKSYNMGGFRIGFAIGGAELIAALRRIKAVVDFNQYQGILQGAIVALEQAPTLVPPTVATFAQRREILVAALVQKGWCVSLPLATPYLWAPLPAPWQDRSLEFCLRLVQETGVALAPGRGFGANGEGYVRFALVQEAEKLQRAVAHIATFVAKS